MYVSWIYVYFIHKEYWFTKGCRRQRQRQRRRIAVSFRWHSFWMEFSCRSIESEEFNKSMIQFKKISITNLSLNSNFRLSYMIQWPYNDLQVANLYTLNYSHPKAIWFPGDVLAVCDNIMKCTFVFTEKNGPVDWPSPPPLYEWTRLRDIKKEKWNHTQHSTGPIYKITAQNDLFTKTCVIADDVYVYVWFGSSSTIIMDDVVVGVVIITNIISFVQLVVANWFGAHLHYVCGMCVCVCLRMYISSEKLADNNHIA